MSTIDPTIVAPLPVAASDRAPRAEGAVRRSGTPVRDPSATRVIGPVGQVTLIELFRDVIAHWDLLYQLAARDVRIRYKQAAMGFAWSVLMPMLVVGAGTLMRIAIVSITGRPLDLAEIGAVVLKAFPWAFFAAALGMGVASVTANVGLVTKIYFPRPILPIAAVGGNLIDLAVGVGIGLLTLPFLGAKLTFALLWVPLLLALLVLLTAGFCTVLSCANLFYRDVKYITQVMLTFGIFFTPVLFESSAFGARGARWLVLNPLAPIFDGLGMAVMRGHNLLEPLVVQIRGVPVVAWQPWYLLYTAAWTVGSLVLGLLLFQRTQDLFAEFA
jgi:ABC-type polysaccharide/polyol phosphate export permease